MFVLFLFIYHLWLSLAHHKPLPPPLRPAAGVSKGVGFIRFDQRNEAERAIQELNGKVPKGCTDPITVKFANNPSNNAKAMPPLAAYLTPQARRFAAGAALPAGRFRLAPNPYETISATLLHHSFHRRVCICLIFDYNSGQFPPNLRKFKVSVSFRFFFSLPVQKRTSNPLTHSVGPHP